jgi:hypothetical protein
VAFVPAITGADRLIDISFLGPMSIPRETLLGGILSPGIQ